MRSPQERFTLLMLGLVLVGTTTAFGQHTQHQTPPPPAGADTPVGAQALSGCPDSARAALQALDALGAQLEQARQTNSPADMRNAVDSVQAALEGLRAQMGVCVTDEAKQSGGGMDHSGHGQKPAAATPQPGTSSPASPDGVDHSKMDHSKMGHQPPASETSPEPSAAVDPVCAMKVDRKTAPQVTYEGTTYYFCSESDRQKFLADPAPYVKKSGAQERL
ncbi:MAG: YHS domain-containing protein [Vicinamibacteraceae bacterium]